MTPESVKVEKGMLLLVDESTATSVRYRLLCVTGVRQTKKGATVTLSGWSPGVTAIYTASFPDGIVADPFCVFALSQRDLGLVWKALHTTQEVQP